ncbi:MAG TPA: histidine kinase [Jatrophihabitantaceae bacterium]|nr:histidine kinase [Jatrophihabitantaceae bacterium]
MIVVLRRVQERIERSCERLGLAYPWWIPAYSTLAVIVISAVAFGQRSDALSAPVIIAALALTLLPVAVWGRFGWLVPPWAEALFTAVAVSLYLTQPAAPDFAPLLFLISAGEIAATMSFWFGMAAATMNIGVLVVAANAGHLQSLSLYIVGVILGADVGIALRWQMRALAAERDNTAIASEQAMLAERQRLAREVHDVVGHSLSINLLHVTAARHALQRHADIDDAVESLVEAERVGRAAMGDLRRTVSVLSSEPSGTQPLPGIDDVSALIEQSRAAGLDVRFERTGECRTADDAAGLGVYRIVQESLANIAKHAPTATAAVSLAADGRALRLCVRNTLPNGSPNPNGHGTGLPGMAARAEQMGAQLRTGVDGEHWLVDLVLPVERSDAR